MTKNIKSYASKYKGRNPAVAHIYRYMVTL